MSKSHREKKRKGQAKAQDKKQKKAEATTLMLESARVPERVGAVSGSPQAATPQAATTQAAFAGAVATIEGSLRAAGHSAVEVNRKLIEIAQTNFNSSLEHAKEMAAARNPIAAMRLHMNYWHAQMGAFTRQSQEFRALQAELVGLAAAPIRAHLRGLA